MFYCLLPLRLKKKNSLMSSFTFFHFIQIFCLAKHKIVPDAIDELYDEFSLCLITCSLQPIRNSKFHGMVHSFIS